jgi:hypothetical protein
MAEQRRDDALKQVLGDARFSQYEKTQDPEYQAVRQIVNRFQLDPDITDQLLICTINPHGKDC